MKPYPPWLHLLCVGQDGVITIMILSSAIWSVRKFSMMDMSEQWVWYSFTLRFAYELVKFFVEPIAQVSFFCLKFVIVRWHCWLFLSYSSNWSINRRWCVTYIHDPNTSLSFDLKVNFLGFLTWLRVQPATVFFCPLTLSYDICFTLVYHHRMMCHIHSWPLYDLDLCSQYQSYIFTMNLCLGKIIFVLWHRHIKFIKFGRWVCHYETTCHSWPVYYLDFWPICGWRGYP